MMANTKAMRYNAMKESLRGTVQKAKEEAKKKRKRDEKRQHKEAFAF